MCFGGFLKAISWEVLNTFTGGSKKFFITIHNPTYYTEPSIKMHSSLNEKSIHGIVNKYLCIVTGVGPCHISRRVQSHRNETMVDNLPDPIDPPS